MRAGVQLTDKPINETQSPKGDRNTIVMKKRKIIRRALVPALLIVALLTGCAQQNYQCHTYSGHYSNLYTNYKTRR